MDFLYNGVIKRAYVTLIINSLGYFSPLSCTAIGWHIEHKSELISLNPAYLPR